MAPICCNSCFHTELPSNWDQNVVHSQYVGYIFKVRNCHEISCFLVDLAQLELNWNSLAVMSVFKPNYNRNKSRVVFHVQLSGYVSSSYVIVAKLSVEFSN